MIKKTLIKIGLLSFLVFTASGNIFSQGLGVPSVSSSMLSQFSNMSPSQKREMASQYGLNMNDLGLDNQNLGIDQIGAPGNEISSEANQVLYERIIDSQDNRNRAEEYRKNNTPIFERDNSTIDDLPIYGQFLFDGDYSTFAPTDNASVPNNYLMGAGDSLKVHMYGIEDLTLSLVVSREGMINFPELGELTIAGMTFIEVRDYIKSQVSAKMIGVEVSISIGRLRSINVFMAGEAKIPGTYSVSGLSTVSQLLFVAGGITDIGSLRNIEVRRSNKLITTFDLYELLIKGNAKDDIRLQSGDVVFIPTVKKTVYVDGSVRRPGKYELIDNESISTLIELTGGLQNRAYLKKISIERYDYKTDIPSIVNLDLTDNENLNFEIIDGDIIRIAEITNRLSNSVILRGAAKRPGKYGWYEGLRFSDILSSINIDFSNNFDMNKGLIVRRKSNSNYDIEVIDFSIKDAIESPMTKKDPLLNLYDEILIFSQGFNDDMLNDIEVYNPRIDIGHPLYSSGEDGEIKDLDTQAQISTDEERVIAESSLEDDAMKNQMSYMEYRVEMYEAKKKAEYDLINKGKRRLLLKPILDKIKQQANLFERSKLVSISGAVKVPGEYPLTHNATYMDLIELAGGYKDDAFIEAAEVRHTLVDMSGSLGVQTSNVDLTILPETKLEERDHLHIRSVKDWDARDTVILAGEVFYPGAYLISPNEPLSSVINRAGGFTNESFIEGAIFTRESIKEKEVKQLQVLGDNIRRDAAARSMTKESEDSSISSSEVEASIEALLSSAIYGRLIIDIPRLMSGDSSSDIVLQDGDVLTIPKFTSAVTVVGEVRRAGSFVLQNNYSIDEYLQLAAGMTARGDKKEIYIIKADGSVKKNNKRSLLSFDDGNNEIQVGDTIVVPIKSSYQTPLNLYSTVSQVVFQSIASIAAFSTILK
ncbi:SLBB domain-containing protein [Woeseiaceae bacterium]|nr:SLBB domain-containing protein [Woeseiaceae bacterium]